MVGNGLYLFENNLSHAVWQELREPLVEGRKYNLLFNVKVFGTGKVRAFTGNENGEKIDASPTSNPVGRDQDQRLTGITRYTVTYLA